MSYFITSDGLRLRYAVEGEGKPIVFVHGWAASRNFWLRQVEELREKYRVVVYDLRGHGDSDKPPDADYRFERLVKDHVELHSYLCSSSATLVGHSFGSLIALKSYFHLKSLVERLILVSLPLYAVRPRRIQNMIVNIILRSEAVSRFILTPLLFGPKVDRETIDFARKESTKASKQALIECLKKTSYPDLYQDLSRVEVPLLVVYGEYEKLVSKREMEKLSGMGAKIRIIRGAGHNLMIENPNMFNRLLRDFVEGKLEG